MADINSTSSERYSSLDSIAVSEENIALGSASLTDDDIVEEQDGIHENSLHDDNKAQESVEEQSCQVELNPSEKGDDLDENQQSNHDLPPSPVDHDPKNDDDTGDPDGIALVSYTVDESGTVVETRVKGQENSLTSPPIVPYDLVYVDNSQGEELSQDQIPLVHYDAIDTKVVSHTNGTADVENNQSEIRDSNQVNGLLQDNEILESKSSTVMESSDSLAEKETSDAIKEENSENDINHTPKIDEHVDIPIIDNATLAAEEKEKGNIAFRKNDFDEALEHYNKAIKLVPSNIIFYINRAATYYNLEEYKRSIKDAEYALELGSKQDADTKLIARTYSRLGYSYKKLNQLSLAITYFNSSLKLRDSTKIRKECLDAESQLIKQKAADLKEKELRLLNEKKRNESTGKDNPKANRKGKQPAKVITTQPPAESSLDVSVEPIAELPSSVLNQKTAENHPKLATQMLNHSSNERVMDSGLEWDSGEFDGSEQPCADEEHNDNPNHDNKESLVSSRPNNNTKGLSKIELMKLQMKKDGVTSSKVETNSNEESMEDLDQEPDDPDSIWRRRRLPKSSSSTKDLNTSRPGIRRVKSETGTKVRSADSEQPPKEQLDRTVAEREEASYDAQNSDPYGVLSDKIEPLKQDELKGRDTGRHHPADLTRGVVYDADYLGTTRLVNDVEWSAKTRINLAKEAIERIKVTSSDFQSCMDVEIVISVRSIIVLQSSDKKLLVETLLHNVSYIADIGNIVVLMTRRHKRKEEDFVKEKSGKAMIEVSTSDFDEDPKGSQVVSHVFSSQYARSIAKSIGQAFDIAYEEFVKEKGWSQEELEKVEYENVLSCQRTSVEELGRLSDINCKKKVVVRKKRNENLGIMIIPSGWGSLIPAPVIAHINKFGPAALGGQLNVGDHLMFVNGISLVALPIDKCKAIIKESCQATEVTLEIVSMSPVTEIVLRRPDTKYVWGFSVQDGLICSVIRGGIAERGGVRVGHYILDIDRHNIVKATHDQVVELLTISTGDLRLRTMPASMYKLMTDQETPEYI